MSDGEVPTFYVNLVGITAQPYDLVMTFGERNPQPSMFAADPTAMAETPPLDRDVVRVQMSYAHAKTMLPLLARLIADYESQWGTVPAPGFEQFGKD